MSSLTPLRHLLAGTMTWAMVAAPSWGMLHDGFDPTDPEVLVSIKAMPEVASESGALLAEYWVSRPELVLVTLTLPAGVPPPPSGMQVPPLRLDGAALPERRCHAMRDTAEAPVRLQIPVTMEEFTRLVKARKLERLDGEASRPVAPEARAPLRELWERLRPMVNDPAFRAHALLREGSQEAITTLLRGGWGANRPTYVGRPPLTVVAAQGNVDGMNVLLRAGAKLNGADAQGRTALHHAILQGHTEFAIELLDRGASLTQADKHGRSPLHLALGERNALLVQNLLERGASPNQPDARGMTALHHGVELAARVAAEEARERSGRTFDADPAVRMAIVKADPLDLVRTLLRFRADPHPVVLSPREPLDPAQDLCGLNAFELALRRDDHAMLEALKQSPLARAGDLPDLRNDLSEEDAVHAFSRLQERIRKLSPSRVFGEYVTRRFRDTFAPASDAEAPAAQARLAQQLWVALDPRIHGILEVRPLLPEAADATPTAWTFSVTPPLSAPSAPTIQLVLFQENGVWKIDRIEGPTLTETG